MPIDSATEKRLAEADWVSIAKNLLHYVLWKLDGSRPPKGHDAEDVVRTAIYKVVSGERRWESEKYKHLLKHLKIAVDSILSDHGAIGFREKGPLSFTEDSRTLDKDCSYPAACDGPDDRAAFFKEELTAGIADDEQLQLLVLALEEGCETPSEVAAETDLEQESISELKRKLARRAAKAMARAEERLSERGELT